MIPYSEAINIVKNQHRAFGAELVSIDDSIHRITATDWVADRDFPPFDKVLMDGIAIKYNAINDNKYQIVGVSSAGNTAKKLNNTNSCFEVMTGSVLPQNADTVIRYEDIFVENGIATIPPKIKVGSHILRKGSIKKAHSTILKSNSKISPAELGMAATIGLHKIAVKKIPKTIIISTGNEVVPIDTIPKNHQIRSSNPWQIKAILQTYGIEPDMKHLNDHFEELKSELEEVIEKYELVILTGGVSMGKMDYVPGVLSSLGVKKLFHKVAQKPGKPLWFGTKKDVTIFALPGNPLSSFICTIVYVRAWLNKCLGLEQGFCGHAILEETIEFKPSLTLFKLSKVHTNHQGRLLVIPIKSGGSSDVLSFAHANGIIRLNSERNKFVKGEVLPIYHIN